MNLALFDFDGTLTVGDSMAKFISYAVGIPNYILGLFATIHHILLYKAKMITNDEAKEKLLRHFFGGWPEEKFRIVAEAFSLHEIDKIIRTTAWNRLLWHRQQGDTVAVVSASMRYWLEPWCDSHGLLLLCTELASSNGRITGTFSTPNCHGPEKVRRIQAYFNLEEFSEIYAYGDSGGDTEMLALAHHAFYRRFS